MSETDAPPGIPPEVLDRLRRSVPLRMDAMGGLTLGGDAVTHPRVAAALRDGLDITDAGEITVRIGPHWCYLTVSDCPLRAVAADAAPDGTPRLHLDDGRSVPLAPDTMWDEPDRGLRCAAPSRISGRPLAVRMTNRAQIDLLPWLEIDDEGRGTLVVGGRRHAIGVRSPT